MTNIIALVFDEVQSGVGRTARCGVTEFDIEPDAFTLAKGLEVMQSVPYL